jgi:hypothetical protein
MFMVPPANPDDEVYDYRDIDDQDGDLPAVNVCSFRTLRAGLGRQEGVNKSILSGA